MKIPKLPFEMSDISGFFSGVFSFSRKEITVILVSVSAVVIAAVVITAVILASGGRAAGPSGREKLTDSVVESAVPSAAKPFLSDFMFYGDGLEESFTGVIYSREPEDKWSDEQVAKYWIDPRIIAADQLEEENKKLILDIFADVP